MRSGSLFVLVGLFLAAQAVDTDVQTVVVYPEHSVTPENTEVVLDSFNAGFQSAIKMLGDKIGDEVVRFLKMKALSVKVDETTDEEEQQLAQEVEDAKNGGQADEAKDSEAPQEKTAEAEAQPLQKETIKIHAPEEEAPETEPETETESEADPKAEPEPETEVPQAQEEEAEDSASNVAEDIQDENIFAKLVSQYVKGVSEDSQLGEEAKTNLLAQLIMQYVQDIDPENDLSEEERENVLSRVIMNYVNEVAPESDFDDDYRENLLGRIIMHYVNVVAPETSFNRRYRNNLLSRLVMKYVDEIAPESEFSEGYREDVFDRVIRDHASSQPGSGYDFPRPEVVPEVQNFNRERVFRRSNSNRIRGY